MQSNMEKMEEQHHETSMNDLKDFPEHWAETVNTSFDNINEVEHAKTLAGIMSRVDQDLLESAQER